MTTEELLAEIQKRIDKIESEIERLEEQKNVLYETIKISKDEN